MLLSYLIFTTLLNVPALFCLTHYLRTSPAALSLHSDLFCLNNTFPERSQELPEFPRSTMQCEETRLKKNSLLLALKRYSSAVNDMEQTILLPSMLRDVPSEHDMDCQSVTNSKDLYDYYHMLKMIRNTVECGLVHHDVGEQKILHKSLEPLLEVDPEAFFYFHLRGLFSVMGTLTKKSQDLTDKYLDIVGTVN